MTLLPSWQRRATTPAACAAPHPSASLPKRPCYYAQSVQHLTTVDATRNFVEFARQRSLSCIGWAFTYTYDRPAVPLDHGRLVWDPRSIVPRHLALSLAEPVEGGTMDQYSALVDLADPAVVSALTPLLKLPLCFVGHELKFGLFCLWQLGLPEPLLLWDTWIHERVRFLGEFHKRYQIDEASFEVATEMQAGEAVEAARETRLSLPETCARYGVAFPFALADARLSGRLERFGSLGDDDTAIEHALASAQAMPQLYAAQSLQATQGGTLQHQVVVEMPWVVPSARMSWAGVCVDATRRAEVVARVGSIRDQLAVALRAHGLTNPGRDSDVEACFHRLGLLEHFREGSDYRFDKEALSRVAHKHPVARLLHHWRRAEDILRDKLLWPQLVGADGRVHADFRQLGAETGRQSSRWPNLLGVSRWLRPLVIPAARYGLGEADWAQIEVGIAAAVFEDEHLLAMFNSGDIYSAMAQHFFAAELPPEDRTCTSLEFKRRQPTRRAQMKVCILGILYGLGPDSLARQLDVNVAQARQLLGRFHAQFPALCEAKETAVRLGAIRGYATTVTGLRRHRAKVGECSAWELNWLGNHPIQGSAADVFKLAGSRLDRLYHHHGARLLVPLHDAFIFEAPLANLETVATLTSQVMAQTLQEMFPVLEPQVTVNIAHPECWNKDGMVSPLDAWAEELAGLLKEA